MQREGHVYMCNYMYVYIYICVYMHSNSNSNICKVYIYICIVIEIVGMLTAKSQTKKPESRSLSQPVIKRRGPFVLVQCCV